uniref:BTB domain-containing protein n=1 Tax=Salix viminalis TaxID=40686 RepID=A0A6N2LDH9_SALVM
MDCSVCSSLPFILRPPRNTICGACYEGAKSPQPLANIQRWMTGMKDRESELNEKISFLSGSIALLKDQILTDIQLKPGNDGPSISAHRALLAARSEIFRNLLDSDACKAPASDTIMLPELDHQELESLLEFLYSGSLPSEKLQKHVYSLTLAADKYDIPYLLKFCERHMLRFLNSSNALDVLEISDACSNKTLKETALNFIVKNMEDVVFSAKYEAFVPENPHLAVQITRALLMDAKNRRVSGV